MSELRVTDTNSANDSKGRALGLEGDDFLFVVGGLLAGLSAFAGLNLLLGMRLVVAAPIAIGFLLLPCAWVLFLRHNRPAGFAGDLFDELTSGKGWTFVARKQVRHE